MMPIDMLWSARHRDSFRVGLILCILFLLLILFFFLVFFEPLILSFMVVVIIMAISLNFMYNHTQKFADVVNALNIDLTNAEIVKLNTVRFTTISHGKFTLYYNCGDIYNDAYYKIWIRTTKGLPVRYDNDFYMWGRDTFFKRFGDDKEIPLSGYITLSDVDHIISLREIRFENGVIANRIVATLDDRWLYSETVDILKTLKVLRKIENKL
jgi:hypothetical protein